MPVKPQYLVLGGAVLIGAALLVVRMIADAFLFGTTTADHPYILFAALLIGAGFVWMGLIPVLQKWVGSDAFENKNTRTFWLGIFIVLGLGLRAMFFGSTPIYEDDWNRYLWDGVTVTHGVNPYAYSPTDILSGDRNAEMEVLINIPDNTVLGRVNNPDLTTIYPPVAQGAFALAALIKPFSLDALRFVYLVSEALTFVLMIKALNLYGRSPLWMALYSLNPLIVYSAFNAAHMDILLSPFLIAALIAIRSRPFIAGVLLSAAAAIKLWPLLLAPILYRQWRHKPMIYLTSAVLIAGLTLFSFWPMLGALGEDSGLSAYSQYWQRSSFLFAHIESGFSAVLVNHEQASRIFVAAVLLALSLWRGLFAKASDDALPLELTCLVLCLLFLSPTGFPWYVMWALIFIPFRPVYGVALLAALVPLYYVRYALGEQDNYQLYTDWLVPLQFGLPLIVLAVEVWRQRRHA